MTVPQPPVPPPAASGTRGSSRVIAILAIALGAAVILGALGSSVFSTVAAASVRTETRTVDVHGVDELEVSVDAASLRLEFADVSEATLEVTSGLGAGAWTLENEDGTLRVETPERFGPRWWIFADQERATLTLPERLAASDLGASMDLAAGELALDGTFGDLEIEVGAGRLSVDGSARTLAADLSAGGAEIDLADVTEAEFSVSAGTIDARLSGAAPRAVTVQVSAGGLDLELPGGAYDVRSDVSAGDFENGLDAQAGARNTVDVTVSAGTVTIDSAR